MPRCQPISTSRHWRRRLERARRRSNLALGHPDIPNGLWIERGIHCSSIFAKLAPWLPARNPPVKGPDLSSGERGEFAGGFQAHGRNHDGYDRSSNGWGCKRRGRRAPQNRRNIWGNARGGRADGVKGNRAGKLVEKQLAPQKSRYKTTSPGAKLLNLKGEWMAMREVQLTAVRAVGTDGCGP